LVDGLNLKNNIGVYWNLLILIRWSLTNTILIILRDHNYGQILCLLVFSLVYQVLMVFGKPYNDKIENQISLFNEVMVSAYLYVLMMLTDYLGENTYRVE
jgi:Fe2+ transport system protein B